MSKKKWTRILALLIAPVIGAILGFLFGEMFHYGWQHARWQMIEKPPVQVGSLAAIHARSLWIRSTVDTIYFNEEASECKTDCWHEVSEIIIPPKQAWEGGVINKACGPSAPLFRITASIAECRVEMFVERNYIFALLNDGNIHFWKASIYEEWAPLFLIGHAITGAIFLFLATLFFVLVSIFLDWLDRVYSQQASHEPENPTS